jgi:ComF family protein
VIAHFVRAAERVAGLAFGGSCFLCRGRADALGPDGLLCVACDADLPRTPDESCPRCGLDSPGGETCGRCLAELPAYDATFAALRYRFPADVLVHALKFRGELALAPWLGRLLAGRVGRAERFDRVLPVPLSAARLRARGYNQAMELARPLAAALGAVLDPLLCERTRDTLAQSDLPWAERARNVRAAFRCARSLDGMAIAVVDDVMTSGATLAEVARTLKQAGAARVVNCVVTRTSPPAEA